MRALGVKTYGGPKNLELLDVEEPTPGQGEVRVRIHAAAVSPTDLILRNGEHAATVSALDLRPPFIPGMDLAGVVDALGPGLDGRLKVGDPVVGIVLPFPAGAYADKIVLPAESVVAAPAGADFVAASTLLMNAATARIALDHMGLVAGQTLAITGASGALGVYAIQLAKAAGITVIADASTDDGDSLRSFGADHLIPRRGDFVGDVLSIVPDGVDGVLDAAVLNGATFGAIRDHGHLAVVRAWDGAGERGIQVHRVYVGSVLKETALLQELVQQTEEGILTLRVADVFAPEDAWIAHEQLESGRVRGRFVIDFSS
ncbi:NADP-dependent oxidoreductase [Paenarthrobacter sp. NPDC090520]|uniref:NADP-dependent oxidoreductase n=1 Tax=Paenarthrobacter sp. NPDC090520 TaxID=3364382 RepID=UPI0038228E13